MAETEEGSELRVWSPRHYETHEPGARRSCRFAPSCEGHYDGCPDAPAEFSERVGPLNASYGTRWIPLCRAAAQRRFSSRVIRKAEEELEHGQA